MQKELVIYFWPYWLKLWRIILIHFLVLKNLKSYFEQIIQEMLLRFLKNIRFLNEKRYEIPFRIRGGFLSGYPLPRQKIPIPGLTKSWAIPTIKVPNPGENFKIIHYLRNSYSKKKVAKLIPIPGLWDFWGFLLGVFSGISNSDPDPRISDFRDFRSSPN